MRNENKDLPLLEDDGIDRTCPAKTYGCRKDKMRVKQAPGTMGWSR